MGKRSTSGARFLVRRSDSEIWSYHRNLAPDIALQVTGEVHLYWSGRTARLTGKRAVAISLSTSDRREAERRRDQIHAQIEQIVDRAMRHVRRTGDMKKAVLAPEELRRIADYLYADVLNKDDTGTTSASPWRQWDTTTAAAERLRDLPEHAALIVLTEPSDDLTDPFDPEVLPIMDRLLRPLGIQIPNNTEDRRRVALAMARALKKAGSDLAARKAGQVIETPPIPSSPILKNDEGKEVGSVSSGMKLRECFEEFSTKKLTNPRTINDYRTHLERFIDLVGDVPIQNVTKKMIVDYAITLEQFPVRYPDAWRSKSILEIIALAKTKPHLQRLSALTINDKALAALKSMFNWAVRRQLIEANPAQGFSLDTPKDIEKKRLPFSIEQLRQIFSQPLFTRGERPNMGGEAPYWVPLIALYCGARIEEICQLRCEDIKCQDGVWYFDIVFVPGETKVKNRDSIRRIPIHQDLIDRGLIEERDRVAKRGEKRLFPALTRTRGDFSHQVSKWWGKWIGKIGITQSEYVFHSFRHSLVDRCKDCRIPIHVAYSFTGHAEGRDKNGYGIGTSLSELNEYMQQLDWSPVFKNPE